MFTRVAVLVSLIACASAKPYLTSPVAGTKCSGGSTCTISWQDDGAEPLLDAFGDATVGLYVGSVNQQTQLQHLSDSVNVATTSTIQFTVDPNAGADSSDYFIRLDSINGKNGTTPYQVFSAKFTLDSMSGEFNSTVLAQIAADNSASGSASSTGSSSSTKAASATSSRASGSSTASASAGSSSSSSAAGRNVGAAGGLVAAVCAGAALLSFAL